MRKILISFCLLASLQAHAGRPYVATAIGLHDRDTDCPEACLNSILFRARLGYEIPITSDWRNSLSFEYVHVSSPRDNEIGKGFNPFYIEFKHTFGD